MYITEIPRYIIFDDDDDDDGDDDNYDDIEKAVIQGFRSLLTRSDLSLPTEFPKLVLSALVPVVCLLHSVDMANPIIFIFRNFIQYRSRFQFF
jgi:hypothetical protein